MSEVFNRDYYMSHCGDEPYLQSSPIWKEFFKPIADAIVLSLRPRRVFDAGCAVGFLVEALWDRGVEAHGRDISEFAISEVRADVRPWCEIGSISDPIDGSYDLVLCIEVVEHMPAEEALAAIKTITSVSDRVLFSSSPTDLIEKTHINVRPTRYWLEQFASCGFAPVTEFDATFLTPHAVLFERSDKAGDEQGLIAFAEIVRQRVALFQERQRLTGDINALRTRLADSEDHLKGAVSRLAQYDAEAELRLSRYNEAENTIQALRVDAAEKQASAEVGAKRLVTENDTLTQLLSATNSRLEHSERRASVSLQQAASYNRQRVAANATIEALQNEKRVERASYQLASLKLELMETTALWRMARLLRSITGIPIARRVVQLAWWTLTFRLVSKLKARRADRELRRKVESSGLFDQGFYVSEYPEIVTLGIDPLRHYLTLGWRKGYRPSSRFDTSYYLSSNSDVAELGINPLVHYIVSGREEGRAAYATVDTSTNLVRETGLFDDGYYLANYPDIEASGFDAAAHFASHGWREGRWPNATFDTQFYLDNNSDVRDSDLNPLVHYAQFGIAEGRPTQRAPLITSTQNDELGPRLGRPQLARVYIASFSANWSALPVFSDARAPRTITVVTDSVDSHSLFGGVGTAIVVGAQLAKISNGRLRLATRSNPPDASAVGRLLDIHKIHWRGATDFAYIPHDGSASLPIGSEDIIITTSWWTTSATRQGVDPRQILYLLQEDERMFYPHGDLRLRCSEALADPDIYKLVNTKLLFDHLVNEPEPLANIGKRGSWFEPAFPALDRPSVLRQKDKMDFFFYARPSNERNLFWRGLEVVDEAVQTGILPPEKWNYHFVGRNIPELILPRGIEPRIWERLPWAEYTKLVANMDLGLCPMYTPHPSYPPLDLAASGAVVVTNTFGLKQSLRTWSRNILAVSPEREMLCSALKDAVILASNLPQRLDNCLNDTISRNWEKSLGTVLSSVLSDMVTR